MAKALGVVLFALGAVASVTSARAQLDAGPMAAALANLGLDLLRQQSAQAKNAEFNAVVSPLSLASALGMVHAGSQGAGAHELASLLGTPAQGEDIYATALPAVLKRMARVGDADGALVMASRIWIDDSIAANVNASYKSVVRSRFVGDLASISFRQSANASRTISDWVALKTANRIPQSIAMGALSADTQVVVTNAIHFKGKWMRPFPTAVPVPFHPPGRVAVDVPTLVGERQLRFATLNGVLVIELPFAGTSLSLFVAVPPVGRALQVFEAELKGQDIAGWSARLGSPSPCLLYMPKFDLAPVGRSLTPALQSLGVKTAFGVGADLTPMLGRAGRGVRLDAVLQSATIKIDEQGGEAAAATVAGAVRLGPVAAQAPTPLCAVDRPFLFALVYKPSGMPLFLGKVADPTQH
jgi:serpin B